MNQYLLYLRLVPLHIIHGLPSSMVLPLLLHYYIVEPQASEVYRATHDLRLEDDFLIAQSP